MANGSSFTFLKMMFSLVRNVTRQKNNDILMNVKGIKFSRAAYTRALACMGYLQKYSSDMMCDSDKK